MSNGSGRYQRGDRGPLALDKLLIVEGRDMWEFFRALLSELGLQGRVEVRDPGGITDWSAYLATPTSLAGFTAVTSLGLVRDCEDDPAQAVRDVCSALRGALLPVPSAVLQPTTTPPSPRVTLMVFD